MPEKIKHKCLKPTVTGYIIHERPYTDTLKFAVIFTKEQGICSVITTNKKPLHYFCPYQLLPSKNKLVLKDPLSSPPHLFGKKLYCALYLNELIYRFCKPGDSHESLFDHYALSVCHLGSYTPLEQVLRRFELTLLQACGFALDTTHIHTPYVIFSPNDGLIGVSTPQQHSIEIELLNQMLYEHTPTHAVKHFFHSILNMLLPTPLQSRLFYETHN